MRATVSRTHRFLKELEMFLRGHLDGVRPFVAGRQKDADFVAKQLPRLKKDHSHSGLILFVAESPQRFLRLIQFGLCLWTAPGELRQRVRNDMPHLL